MDRRLFVLNLAGGLLGAIPGISKLVEKVGTSVPRPILPPPLPVPGPKPVLLPVPSPIEEGYSNRPELKSMSMEITKEDTFFNRQEKVLEKARQIGLDLAEEKNAMVLQMEVGEVKVLDAERGLVSVETRVPGLYERTHYVVAPPRHILKEVHQVVVPKRFLDCPID